MVYSDALDIKASMEGMNDGYQVDIVTHYGQSSVAQYIAQIYRYGKPVKEFGSWTAWSKWMNKLLATGGIHYASSC